MRQRRLVTALVGVFVCCTSILCSAQSVDPRAARAPEGVSWAASSAPKSTRSRVLKGAIVGGAIGATAMVILANVLCDGAHCSTIGYVNAGLLGGGAGAGIGAGLAAATKDLTAGPQPLFSSTGFRRAVFLTFPLVAP